MARIIIHDTRLMGRVEAGLGHVITVDATTPITQAFRSAINAATTSSDELVIACHGYMSHSYNQASNQDLKGGQGLQLCRESLMMRNLPSASILHSCFSKIWLMACGPAGTILHGSRPFCRELAYHTNTVVIASDKTQYYYASTSDSVTRTSRLVLRFGSWEGGVYEFYPDGTMQSMVGSSYDSPLP